MYPIYQEGQSMHESPTLFNILNISSKNITRIAQATSIPVSRLKYYNGNHKLPVGEDSKRLCDFFQISENELSLKLGVIDRNLLQKISDNAEEIYAILATKEKTIKNNTLSTEAEFSTGLGRLYRSDCIDFMKQMDSESVDMIFADPPFNLNKLYPSKMNDSLKTEEYTSWQEQWISECIRILKHGGSLFIWNLPKWNSIISKYLDDRLTFKHWIAVDLRYSLPISGRLYPAHYSLLYYIKGERPTTFSPDRVPMEICPKCFADLVDYGGYKDKMNPDGVNLSDIWYDIPPVRHSKYKRRIGANELSIKLLDRIIEMATKKNDLVFDPFGGSGTTYIVSEIKQRRWVGTEIGPLDDIINRFSLLDEEKEFISAIRENLNCLFTNRSLKARREQGLWTPDSVRKTRIEQQLFLYNR